MATKIEILENRVNTLTETVNNLSIVLEKLQSKKGPSSTREMTTEDAERCINGDLKGFPHKKAAEELGLSYGQVYSARGGYTFKNVKKVK